MKLNPDDHPDFFLTSCAGKEQCPSEAAAFACIKFYQLEHASILDIYLCSFGDHWHYGH